ncbi:hypothetical protein C0Q70_11696 [Pomacea canaliculata]|uniref:Uncharacterized protein n=1 Tax=Pomacea canaliculata TaxID=400727 RepID=A0A2T7P6R7_POMCA|nr:hypothetical protein C0Q70_11696 [Pomacea canaliculata]
MTSVLLLVVLALVSLWWLLTRRPVGVPPGPGFALPVLGHLHLLKSDPRQQFTTWRRQYGDVFSLYMGSQLVVVLNGYKVIKDALVKHADAFSDRPHFPIAEYLKSTGVIESSGPIWKAQRKTALEILRGFGFGKNILAERIQEEVTEYLKAIAEKKGQPQEPGPDDPEENAREAGSASIVQTFPFLRFIPGDPFGVRKLFESFARILNTFVKPFIERHIEDYDENCVDDFISAYLREIEKVKQQPAAEFINNTEKVVCTRKRQSLRLQTQTMFGIEFVPETTSFLLLVVLALVSLWWLSTRRPAGLPPGPGFALPVLGHMHLLKLKSDPRQLFAAWRRQYGDVFSLYVGSRLVVVLNGYKVIKRRWSNKLTSSPTDRTFLLYKFLISEVISDVTFLYAVPLSLLDTSGPVWKAQRKTSLEILREFGMGKNILAEKDSGGGQGVYQCPRRKERFQTQTMLGIEFVPETTSFLLLVVLALVSLWWLSTRRSAGLPPGPGFALPVLGHMHLLKVKSDTRQQFAAWRRQYGDVFSLYVGSQLVVVLNGYKVIKDALVKQADIFSDRPHFPLDQILNMSGVIDTSGPVWKAQRKTSLEILREFGMGKNILAEKIQEEVKEYINALAEKKGQPQDLARMTQVSVSNNISSIVFGKRFEYEDPVFKRYIQALEENIQAVGTASFLQTFPALRHLPGDPFGIRKILENFLSILNTLIKPFIDIHVKDYDENSVDDFISAYLRKIAKAQQKPTADFINGE